MRSVLPSLLVAFFTLFTFQLTAQKKGLESINRNDLKMHMEFLASDELKGRDTGEPGLEIAARYLAVHTKALGLTPADPDNEFFQKYVIQDVSRGAIKG